MSSTVGLENDMVIVVSYGLLGEVNFNPISEERNKRETISKEY